MRLGAFTLPIRSLTNAISSSGATSWPGLSSTTAVDPLAPLLVGQPDHRAVAHRGVLHQRLLDLGRVDVEAAGDDHVLQAVDDEQVALVVEVADVAGVVPAEARGRGGRLRVLVVAGHHERAAHDDLAALAGRQQRPGLGVHDPHLHQRRGPPGGRRGAAWPPSRPASKCVGGREHRDHHRRLALAEQLRHHGPDRPRAPPRAGRSTSAPRRTRSTAARRGRCVRSAVVAEQHVDQRRRQERVRDPLLLDERQEAAEVGSAHDDDPPAERHHREAQDAGGVRQRREREVRRAARERVAHQRQRGHRLEVARREHHALGQPGRAARPDEHREVVRRLGLLDLDRRSPSHACRSSRRGRPSSRSAGSPARSPTISA